MKQGPCQNFEYGGANLEYGLAVKFKRISMESGVYNLLTMKKWEIHGTHGTLANIHPDETFSMSMNNLKARILFATNISA